MSEYRDFVESYPEFFSAYWLNPYKQKRDNKKAIYKITITKEMKKQIKDLGGAVALKRFIDSEHKKLGERNEQRN
jgi:hypothetical protein